MKAFPQRCQGKKKPNQNFLEVNPHICELWSANQAASVRAVTFCSQPECGIIKNRKSIFLCAAFIVSKGTQPVRVIPFSNQAREAWKRRLLKTYSYLRSRWFVGREGWEALGVGRQGGTTDPGRPSVLGEGCIWLGRQSALLMAKFAALRERMSQALHTWSTTASSSSTEMTASPAPSWHGLIFHPFAQLFVPERGGCIGDGVLGLPKLVSAGAGWHFCSLPAPSLPLWFLWWHVFPLAATELCVERLYFKLRLHLCSPTVFCHLNVSQEITLRA